MSSPVLRLPRASVSERARISAALLAPTLARGVIVRRPGGVAAVGALDADRHAVETLRRLRAAHGPGPVRVDLFGRRTVLLLEPDQVRRVLRDTPEPFTSANAEKQGALSHFQPHGLLISEGRERQRRRAFNEAALDTPHRTHGLADFFLAVIREEVEILDRALGPDGELTWSRFTPSFWNAVRRITLGDTARDDQRLTDLLYRLRSDANWFYLRPRRDRLRAEFDERLRAHLDRADPRSLAGAFAAGDTPGDVDPAGQVPHWLFAFDAAAIAVFRALALLASHPEQAEAVRAELDAHNPAAAEGVAGMELLRATVLESVRLWPTTLAILRDSTEDTEWDGAVVPAGTAFVILSAFFHRDSERLPYADRFTPGVWLDGTAEEDGLVPFSGGAADCAGRNLVLFTTTALLAALLERREPRLAAPAALRPDRPLPYSLNHFALRLATRPVRPHGLWEKGTPPRRRTDSAKKGTTAMSNPTFVDVQKALSGVDYPASRDDLVNHARGKGADDRVLEALRGVADRSYSGPSEVSKAVSETTGGR